MTFRRFLLISMLVALALCAIVGVVAVVAGSRDSLGRMLGTAIATAVATGLMLPITWLTSREKLRVGGFTGMAVVLVCWLAVVALFWLSAITGRAGRWYEEPLLFTILFTVVIGLPVAIVLLVVSFRWARVAAFTFVGGAAVAYLVCEFGAISMPAGYRGGSIFESGLTLYGMSACAAVLLVNLGCGDKRYFRWAGVVAAAAATALFFWHIWDPSYDLYRWVGDRTKLHAGNILLSAALVMAHINLVLMAKLRRSQQWLQWATMGTSMVAGTAAIFAIALTYDPDTEWAQRTASGAGIVAACGSLALIVLTVLNRKMEAPTVLPGALEATAMDIVCPRCHTAQSVGFGDSTCKSCDLRFSILVTEPRCAACGYLLYQLTGDKCPECGAPLGAAAVKNELATS